MTSLDPGDDFARVTDGLRPVTYCRPGTSLRVAIAHALRQATARSDANRTADEDDADAIWHLPAAEVADGPRPGDVLVDGDDQHWTVLAVQPAALGSRWRCACRNLVRAFGLDQFIDVEKASYGKTDQGEQTVTWHTWRTGLRANIQPLSTETTREHDQPATLVQYRIYCEEPLELDHHHRIRGPDGATYRILGTNGLVRFDVPLEITVVKNA